MRQAGVLFPRPSPLARDRAVLRIRHPQPRRFEAFSDALRDPQLNPSSNLAGKLNRCCARMYRPRETCSLSRLFRTSLAQ
eukprot:scaffold271_cov252-Pinguiococcus_pyrenoidosus.AAC.5